MMLFSCFEDFRSMRSERLYLARTRMMMWQLASTPCSTHRNESTTPIYGHDNNATTTTIYQLFRFEDIYFYILLSSGYIFNHTPSSHPRTFCFLFGGGERVISTIGCPNATWNMFAHPSTVNRFLGFARWSLFGWQPNDFQTHAMMW